VAAGLLIIEEAGGKTADFSGKPFPLSGREIIATNAYVYDEFYSIVSRGFKASKPKIDPEKELF
jgi:fructose-1,6-bisphosphatase/inositol monophosphatase family enzyme